MKTYLTIRQAMTVVHVSRRTMYNWFASGKLPYLRTVSGRIRIDPEQLIKAVSVPDINRSRP